MTAEDLLKIVRAPTNPLYTQKEVDDELLLRFHLYGVQCAGNALRSFLENVKLSPSKLFKTLNVKRIFLEDEVPYPDKETVSKAWTRLFPDAGRLLPHIIWEDDAGYNFCPNGAIVVYAPDGASIWFSKEDGEK